MNASLLKALSAAISDNPVHMLQLRKIVVALAISGRLNEAGASTGRAEMLALLDDVKRRLISQRTPAKRKLIVPVTRDQLPEEFSDPSQFISLGQIAKVEKGNTGIQQAKPGLYPLVVTAAERITADHFDFDGAAAIIPLVSSTGHGNASINRLHYQEGQFALGTILAAVLPYDPALFSARFLFEYLSAFKEELLVSRMSGTANVTLTLGRIEDVPVPLVPPAIQQQLDELMALCDALEAARTERETKRDRLAAASLARLHTPDPETFRDDARFALNALPALTARQDQIKQLRQTILNLAFRGKLVPQDPADEPAAVLLKRIVDEREAIVVERKIRGATPPQPPFAEAENLDLPSSWKLCALGQITLITDPNPSHRYPDYSGGNIPILSTREFAGDDGWNPSTSKLVTQAFWEFQKENCDFSEGDIMFARKGRLGLPRFLPQLDRFTFSHTLFSIKPMNGLDPVYLLWMLKRGEVVAWLTNEMNQNTGVPTLGKAKTERLPIPLPPLSEQHRIVAKVDELMALCDQLETSLTSADETRKKLLDALLAEALAPVDAEALQEAAE